MESAFQTWMLRLEELASTLANIPLNRPDIIVPAISAFLEDYKVYYNAKSYLADTNMVSLLSPTWLTPLECTFLWIAGWKPSHVYRIAFYVDPAPECHLSQEQSAALERLRSATAVAERRLSEDMIRAQESMASQHTLTAILGQTQRNGDARTEAIEVVLRALREVVVEADELRERTVSAILAILTPAQAAKFLFRVASYRLCIRSWGLHRRNELNN